MQKSDNKRIAKNTLFLYFRMMLVMAVTLFTSRIILNALGADDFGVYNVVGGLSTALIFFSSTLTVSTQRFLNFELGRGNVRRVKEIFNSCLLLFVLIAVIVLVVGVTAGRWFVLNKLVIPESQQHAAVVVLYATVISLCSMFIFSVYESVLIARENMKIYAYIGVIDSILKLGLAYLIILVNDKLIVYAILMMVIQLLPKMFMAIYCVRKYPEVKHEFIWDRALLKELVGFTGWNIYGSSVWMINGQGMNILLNMFFGPVVNAANGIATQVNNAVNNFAINFFTAVRPQIVKRYSVGDYDSLISLLYKSSRFSFYLLWILSLPLILRCEYVVSLWLKDVPEYTVSFVQWILIYSMVNSFNNPLWTAMSATGHLKRSVVIGSNLFLLAFPLSYIALKMGGVPMVVYPILSLGRLAFLLVTIYNLSKYVNVTIVKYAQNVFIPICKISLLTYGICYVVDSLFGDTFMSFICVCVIVTVTNIVMIYLLGITKNEKTLLIQKLSTIVERIRRK